MSEAPWYERAWEGAKTFFKDTVKGAKRVYETYTEQDPPDPLPGCEDFDDDDVGYFEFLSEAYQDKLDKLHAKIKPYQDKIDELKKFQAQNEEARLQRAANLREVSDQIEGNRKDSQYFRKRSNYYKKLEGKGADLDKKRAKHATLPDADPEVNDTLMGKGPIRLNLYLRLLESQIHIIRVEGKEDYLEEQLKRSKYWLEKAEEVEDEEKEDE